MKTFQKLALVCTILLSSSLLHATSKKTDAQTILGLGEQMSNLVNMLETYALIGLSVSYETPVRRLKNGITDYDMMLVNLETGYNDKQIQQSVEKIRRSWKRIRRALYGVLVLTDKKTMKLNAAYINHKMRLAVDELNRMKNYLMEEMGNRDKKLIDAAILMGVSAQRLSSNYMMKAWEVKDPNIEKYWNKNMETFSLSLQTLKQSPFADTPQFKKELAKCERAFRYFVVLFNMHVKTPALVHKKAIKVTENSHMMIKQILAN